MPGHDIFKFKFKFKYVLLAKNREIDKEYQQSLLKNA